MSFNIRKIILTQKMAKLVGGLIGGMSHITTALLPRHIRFLARIYMTQFVTRTIIVRNGISYVANGPVSYIRIFATSEKEVETCDWIEAFPQHAVFWDIGANIGIFSLMAAKRGIVTYAFEPHPANYLNLIQNIDKNRFSSYIAAFPVALHNKITLSSLHLSTLDAGMASNSFSVNDSAAQRVCKMEAIGFSVDAFIDQFGLPVPTHIKMDVDGNELKILQGAEKTLANPLLKELLIEVDTDEKTGNYHDIENTLMRAGFYRKSFHVHGKGISNVIYARNKS